MTVKHLLNNAENRKVGMTGSEKLQVILKNVVVRPAAEITAVKIQTATDTGINVLKVHLTGPVRRVLRRMMDQKSDLVIVFALLLIVANVLN